MIRAFVLSGGANLGPIQVGALRALLEHNIRPDIVVGCSAGALNAGYFAQDISLAQVERLGQVWRSVKTRDIYPEHRVGALWRLLSGQDSFFSNRNFYAFLQRQGVTPAQTFGFFPMPLADNMLAPAHPAGPSKFIYSGSPHIEEARQYLTFLTTPENLQYLLDNTPDFAALNFSGLQAKWTPEQQEFLDAYPAKSIVYQDAVNYLNPQWMDIGKDMVAMFTGAMTPEDVLKSIDQRRADMAKTANDPAWAE